MAQRGSKGKYQKWIEPNGLLVLQGWARDGLTDEQIAHNCGISAVTLYDWKKRFPDISKALKQGKEVIDYAVEGALLKQAMSGNVTAQIYWLKNRKPDKWRDQVKEKAHADVEDDPLTKSIYETAGDFDDVSEAEGDSTVPEK